MTSHSGPTGTPRVAIYSPGDEEGPLSPSGRRMATCYGPAAGRKDTAPGHPRNGQLHGAVPTPRMMAGGSSPEPLRPTASASNIEVAVGPVAAAGTGTIAASVEAGQMGSSSPTSRSASPVARNLATASSPALLNFNSNSPPPQPGSPLAAAGQGGQSSPLPRLSQILGLHRSPSQTNNRPLMNDVPMFQDTVLGVGASLPSRDRPMSPPEARSSVSSRTASPPARRAVLVPATPDDIPDMTHSAAGPSAGLGGGAASGSPPPTSSRRQKRQRSSDSEPDQPARRPPPRASASASSSAASAPPVEAASSDTDSASEFPFGRRRLRSPRIRIGRSSATNSQTVAAPAVPAPTTSHDDRIQLVPQERERVARSLGLGTLQITRYGPAPDLRFDLPPEPASDDSITDEEPTPRAVRRRDEFLRRGGSGVAARNDRRRPTAREDYDIEMPDAPSLRNQSTREGPFASLRDIPASSATDRRSHMPAHVTRPGGRRRGVDAGSSREAPVSSSRDRVLPPETIGNTARASSRRHASARNDNENDHDDDLIILDAPPRRSRRADPVVLLSDDSDLESLTGSVASGVSNGRSPNAGSITSNRSRGSRATNNSSVTDLTNDEDSDEDILLISEREQPRRTRATRRQAGNAAAASVPAAAPARNTRTTRRSPPPATRRIVLRPPLSSSFAPAGTLGTDLQQPQRPSRGAPPVPFGVDPDSTSAQTMSRLRSERMRIVGPREGGSTAAETMRARLREPATSRVVVVESDDDEEEVELAHDLDSIRSWRRAPNSAEIALAQRLASAAGTAATTSVDDEELARRLQQEEYGDPTAQASRRRPEVPVAQRDFYRERREQLLQLAAASVRHDRRGHGPPGFVGGGFPFASLLGMARSRYGFPGSEISSNPANYLPDGAIDNATYESLLALSDRIGAAIPRTISRSAVDSLPKRKRKEEEKQCSVCMEDFEDDDAMLTALPDCDHGFHPHCIGTWLTQGNATCPM